MAVQRLKEAAEKAKIELSSALQVGASRSLPCHLACTYFENGSQVIVCSVCTVLEKQCPEKIHKCLRRKTFKIAARSIGNTHYTLWRM